MPDLADGESFEMQGSGSKPYVLKNSGGVYSCTCPAWRNQSTAIERRTCKHLRKLRGDAAEEERLGGALPQKPVKATAEGAEAEGPPLLLAESWDTAADLSGWWMSEKLDGVRAFWDGRQFLSRQGNLYHAPDWFVEGFPDTPLDGELWIGRKAFQKTVGIVRRQDKTELWRSVRFEVFDAPQAVGGFEDRIKFLEDAIARMKNEFVHMHAHELCRGVDHLREELRRVESLGGEGLMLRQPGSKYHAGRSSTLLKVKTFHDAEAVVIGHLPGAGKHAGRLGALAARLPDGTEFSVGTGFSDRERSAPPPIGATITFRYQELSEAGVPRFPSYVGVRADAPPVDVTSKGMTTAARKAATPKPAATIVVSSPAPAAATGPTAAATASGGPRYFEFVDEKSSKFWEITWGGCELTTRWGRIGAAGQSKTKTFADESAATAAAEKLLEEKIADGYIEKLQPPTS
jgi:DNA ligase-1